MLERKKERKKEMLDRKKKSEEEIKARKTFINQTK